ncbi:IS4 family transposase [Desulforhopalus vacuolatus]|uniref:IS4 family transposase n=1 Tax=Desulforhopalus vacuolatus TaxID=40414 RepID=UPI001966911C|nr:IS4 family transposase [Desulforhopalus vacuolatus]
MDFVTFRSRRYAVPSQTHLLKPTKQALVNAPPLRSRSNKPLAMNTEDLLNILTYYHLQEFSSGRELIQALQEDDYARDLIAPAGGIKRSTFFDTVNDRGVEQLLHVFTELQKQIPGSLPSQYFDLGDLVALDGSLIDSVLSMHWAEYRSKTKKAKLHLGFDLNHGVPHKLFLTEGKGAERPFVSKIINPGQTGVLDRGYQAHKLFDQWQLDGCHFVCRIKRNTRKTIIEELPVEENSHVFFDANVLLGTPYINQSTEPLRLVGYNIAGKQYWVATDRFDLSAEQIAFIYKLRWNIENFFAWWKRHLKVYHLFARSKNGMMVQILSGLITYILLAIYCQEKHGESVSIRRVRQLRNQIRNEARQQAAEQAAAMQIHKRKCSPRPRKRLKKKHAIF